MTSALKSVAKLKRRPPEGWPPTIAPGKIEGETVIQAVTMADLRAGDVILSNSVDDPVELYRVQSAEIVADNKVSVTVEIARGGRSGGVAVVPATSAVRVRRRA